MMTGGKPGPPCWVWLIVLYFAGAAVMGLIFGLVAVAAALLFGWL
jgi:hypothetical protein